MKTLEELEQELRNADRTTANLESLLIESADAMREAATTIGNLKRSADQSESLKFARPRLSR